MKQSPVDPCTLFPAQRAAFSRHNLPWLMAVVTQNPLSTFEAFQKLYDDGQVTEAEHLTIVAWFAARLAETHTFLQYRALNRALPTGATVAQRNRVRNEGKRLREAEFIRLLRYFGYSKLAADFRNHASTIEPMIQAAFDSMDLDLMQVPSLRNAAETRKLSGFATQPDSKRNSTKIGAIN